jgi:hypothetical protein
MLSQRCCLSGARYFQRGALGNSRRAVVDYVPTPSPQKPMNYPVHLTQWFVHRLLWQGVDPDFG